MKWAENENVLYHDIYIKLYETSTFGCSTRNVLEVYLSIICDIFVLGTACQKQAVLQSVSLMETLIRRSFG